MATTSGSSKTRQLLLYFGLMSLLVNLVNPGFLLDIPTSYMLKNVLHASASRISGFRLLTGIPFYLGFVFGMVRDLWSPFGRRDPGYFLLFVPVMALILCWMGLSRTTYAGLLIGMLAAMVSYSFIFAAFQGLIALIGQEALMSGRMSALSNIFLFLPVGAAYFASGFMTENLSPRHIFLVVLVLTTTLSVFGVWKPRSVFSHAYNNPHAKGTNFLGDVKRLLRHRAIYPVVLINLLWNFTPGSYTPMQFFLTNQLHASDAIYADFAGLYNLSFFRHFCFMGFFARSFHLVSCFGGL
jgi:MFS family permease